MNHITTYLASGLLLLATAFGAVSAAEIATEADAAAQPEVMAKVDTVQPGRLWLPSRQENLRELLVAAAYQALADPECAEVLYGRLNEYRSESDETAFTILCMRDPRYTFNLVFNASDLEPAVENRQEAVSNTEDLQRLRALLGDIPAAVRAGNSDSEGDQASEEPQDTTAPVLF